MNSHRVGSVGIDVSDVDLDGADILGSDQPVGGRAVGKREDASDVTEKKGSGGSDPVRQSSEWDFDHSSASRIKAHVPNFPGHTDRRGWQQPLGVSKAFAVADGVFSQPTNIHRVAANTTGPLHSNPDASNRLLSSPHIPLQKIALPA
jgi:hypothetical protein